jgi:hypothetical protein
VGQLVRFEADDGSFMWVETAVPAAGGAEIELTSDEPVRGRTDRAALQNRLRAAQRARGFPRGRRRPVASARRGSRRPATMSTQSS